MILAYSDKFAFPLFSDSMAFRKLVLFFFLIISYRAAGQTPSEQDCPNAIPVCQSSYTQPNSYTGTGNIPNEINSGISCLSSGEKNDVWYTFTVTNSGNLNFLITPNSFTDDYDWAIYNLTNATCADIYTNQALQVSCNYSATSGSTGANGGSTLNSQDASGTPFNALIPVTVGETYVVNVSNFSSTQFGYTLNFGNSTAGIYDNVPPDLLSISQPLCGDSVATFNFSENILCSSVQVTDFSLFGPNTIHTVISATGNACMSGADYDNTISISVTPPMTDTGLYYLIVVDSVVDICNNTTGITTDTLSFVITGVSVSVTPASDSMCMGETVTFTASGTNTYNWAPATGLSSSTGASVVSSSATSVTYLVTGTTNGCSDTASATLVVSPLPVVSVNPSSVVICIGNPVPLVASGAFTYNWSPSLNLNATTGDSVVATPDTTSSYAVIGTDINGCSDTDSVTIVVDTSLAVNISPDSAFICFGDSVLLAATGSATYSWAPSSGLSGSSGDTVFAFPSSTTNYVVTGNSFGCIGYDSILVTVYPIPVVTISPANPVICYGDTLNLVASGATGYSWIPSAGMSDTVGSSINVFPVDTAGFTVIGSSNGCIDTAGILVTVNFAAPANAGTNTGFCPGGTAVIGSDPVAGCTYLWSPGIGLWAGDSSRTSVTLQNSNHYTEVHSYVVSVTKDNCTSADTVQVSVYPNPVVVCEVSPKAASEFSPTVYFSSQSLAGSVCTWYFENGDFAVGCEASYTYPDTGTYPVKLEVLTANGCYGESSCNAVVYPEYSFYIPNAFSPNGDEMNDLFFGSGKYVKKFQERIFDRWGNLIFQTDNPENHWDGKIKNTLAPQGVYVYKIDIGDVSGKAHSYMGKITLIR